MNCSGSKKLMSISNKQLISSRPYVKSVDEYKILVEVDC